MARPSSIPLLEEGAGLELPECVRLGILRERDSERRVSIDPAVVQLLVKDGYKVSIEAGAGEKASFTDDSYSRAGARVQSRLEVLAASDVLFRIDAPVEEFDQLAGKVVVSWVGRLLDSGKEIIARANALGVTLLDVTAVPRITIAQKLDVLSSQAKVAGHRAVLEAAHVFQRFHQSEMTAAGKFPPSQTFVLGCGVAGLAAIGTSRALGSIVRAWDVRDVSDQVQSMGASWVKVEFKEDGAAEGGYAKESSAAFLEAQRETFFDHLRQVDIAITTAAIPGRPSPQLITEDMVSSMKAGSVVVDLAAVGGGNCALTKKDEIVETPNGVTIIGFTDLPARMAAQASAMYAQNMMNLLRHVHGKDGASAFVANLGKQLDLGEGGEIVARSIVTCRRGELVAMPPPASATSTIIRPNPPAGAVAGGIVVSSAAGGRRRPADSPMKNMIVLVVVLSLAILAILIVAGEDEDPYEKTSGKKYHVRQAVVRSFLLAGVAGYQAVWGVAHSLHTPLMSVTNAISGMTAIGGLELLENHHGSWVAVILAVLATTLSAVNISGGFIITQRMLSLFRRPGDVDLSGFLIVPGLILAGWSVTHPGSKVTCNTLSSMFCVAAIASLASIKTANMGCKFGIIGVACAVVTYLESLYESKQRDGGEADKGWFIVGVVCVLLGSAAGSIIGLKVDPMSLPQTVAAFHSLVGASAMFTSIGAYSAHVAEYWAHAAKLAAAAALLPGVPVVEVTSCVNDFGITTVSSFVGNFIGGITLSGSVVAFCKLHGMMSSKPLNLPHKNLLNLAGLLTTIGLLLWYAYSSCTMGTVILWFIAIISGLLGYHLVASVGGGDMPVCVTVLNSYSGWALAAEGFQMNIPMLAIIGSIIGFSGAILTKIMCDAMNRDILNVIFGGMKVAPPAAIGDAGPPKEHTETTVDVVADLLSNAKEVLIVPGYGMAVARAQNAVGEVAKCCREAGINCRFAIHPVAGRMPGQMNVLLAEAGVPYDWVTEMDEVNPHMESVDVCIVMGANDITNSASIEVEGCSIYGMPVIEVWRCKKVIFCKRSMGGGYADLENPVFFKENTSMLLGDAGKTASELVVKLKDALHDKV